MNTYFFSLFIHFNKDIDSLFLESKLKIKPTKFTPLNNSKGENKSAKFYYKSKEYSGYYSDDEFEKFLFSMSNNLKDLPAILKEYDGECGFSLVFTELNDSPCISLSSNAIRLLNYLNARFDVDFI